LIKHVKSIQLCSVFDLSDEFSRKSKETKKGD